MGDPIIELMCRDNERERNNAERREQRLRAALKWALDQGAYASRDGIRDRGCGHGSEVVKPPVDAEGVIEDVRREIIRERTNGKVTS